jgi:hypothetical protein
VADGGGLENRYGVTPIKGSNPLPSAEIIACGFANRVDLTSHGLLRKYRWITQRSHDGRAAVAPSEFPIRREPTTSDDCLCQPAGGGRLIDARISSLPEAESEFGHELVQSLTHVTDRRGSGVCLIGQDESQAGPAMSVRRYLEADPRVRMPSPNRSPDDEVGIAGLEDGWLDFVFRQLQPSATRIAVRLS